VRGSNQRRSDMPAKKKVAKKPVKKAKKVIKKKK
jgi:hypothetical protein